MQKRRLKKSIKITLAILVLFIAIVIFGLSFYGYQLSSVSDSENKEVLEIEIKDGDTGDSILKKLKDKNLIRSELFVKIYMKLNGINNLQAGKYEVDNSKSSIDIINILSKGEVSSKDEISITFPEGKNMRDVAKRISTNTNNSENDVFDLLKDDTYLDLLIDEYWFITDDIKNNKLYYPLEGYLFPDTYIFKNKDVSVKDIFKKMLDQMNTILDEYKTDIQKLDFSTHEFLTFASVVQSEGVNDEVWAKIAGVFYNRLEDNMAFQSCVTACYAAKEDNCVPQNVPTKYDSPYNTYLASMAGKLPIGPVSSIGEAAIKASVYPDDNDYLFFVADKSKNTYFSKTLAEHNKKVQELKAAGNFPE